MSFDGVAIDPRHETTPGRVSQFALGNNNFPTVSGDLRNAIFDPAASHIVMPDWTHGAIAV
jgi:hypothetical protein